MNFYFFAFISLQIILCLAIAQIAKSIDSSLKTNLTVTRYLYLKNANIEYFDCLFSKRQTISLNKIRGNKS